MYAFRYTPQCANLIAKYKTTMNFLSDAITNLETFMNDYKVSLLCMKYVPTIFNFFLDKLTCPAAVNRFKIGVPATYEHAIGDNSKDVGKSAKYIAESVLVSCSLE